MPGSLGIARAERADDQVMPPGAFPNGDKLRRAGSTPSSRAAADRRQEPGLNAGSTTPAPPGALPTKGPGVDHSRVRRMSAPLKILLDQQLADAVSSRCVSVAGRSRHRAASGSQRCGHDRGRGRGVIVVHRDEAGLGSAGPMFRTSHHDHDHEHVTPLRTRSTHVEDRATETHGSDTAVREC